MKLAYKLKHEYANVPYIPQKTNAAEKKDENETIEQVDKDMDPKWNQMITAVSSSQKPTSSSKGNKESTIVAYKKRQQIAETFGSSALIRRRPNEVPTPKWHAPWKLKTVIAGHIGWVRSIAVDPTNDWFVTGSADRSIKVWDLASGQLKLTLTGHINCIRGLAVSPRHPYLFSAGEDKKVLCWDLEYNKVIRSYHGHLSGVFSLKIHPTLDVLITGGRDSVARVSSATGSTGWSVGFHLLNFSINGSIL